MVPLTSQRPRGFNASNTIVCLISYSSFFLCVLVRINKNILKPRKVLWYGCPESWSSWRFRVTNSSADSSCYSFDLVFSKVRRKLYLFSRSNIYAIRKCVYTSTVMFAHKNKHRRNQTGRISTWELDTICEYGTENGTHYIGFMDCTSSYQTRTFSPILCRLVLVAGRALQEMTRTRSHLPVHLERALRDKKTFEQKSMVRRECYRVTLTRLELAISWSEVRRLVH